MRIREIQQLSEVKMSGAVLEKEVLNSPVADQLVIGFEAEMCYPASVDTHDEPDYSYNETITRQTDLSDIESFFSSDYYSMRRLIRDFGDAKEHKESEFRDEWFRNNETPEKSYQELSQEYSDYTERTGNGTYNFWEWCDDSGFETYVDIAESYGFDWPYTNTVSTEMTITQSINAIKFQEMVGRTVVLANDRRSFSENYFVISPDGSIEPPENTDDEQWLGIEVVSPPADLRSGLKFLEKTIRWAGYNSCETNESTGLHVGVSLRDVDQKSQLDYVKLVLFLGDKKLIADFSRVGNEFCKSALEFITSRADSMTVNAATDIIELMKTKMLSAASSLIALHNGVGSNNRYTSVNSADKDYTEFRAMGGDYLNVDYTALRTHILRCCRAYVIACDEALYRDEYIKKMYKLLTSSQQFSDVRLAPFISYVAGDISKDDLKSELKSTFRAAWKATRSHRG